jgi:hypothetical protein
MQAFFKRRILVQLRIHVLSRLDPKVLELVIVEKNWEFGHRQGMLSLFSITHIFSFIKRF